MSLELEDVPAEFRPAVTATLDEIGIEAGHLAIEVVGEERIRELNREYRGLDKPTDVLSFPVDEDPDEPGPRELGDIFLCPDFCVNEIEAVVHGVLHLCGFDHETDQGEMLDRQDLIVTGLGIDPKMTVEAIDE